MQAFENKQGLCFQMKEARKAPFFEVTFHSENELYATQFTLESAYFSPFETASVHLLWSTKPDNVWSENKCMKGAAAKNNWQNLRQAKAYE